MAEPTPKYTDAQLQSDDVGKKEIITYFQETASKHFLAEHKLGGTVKNVTKKKTKDQLIADYKTLFESKDFKKEGEEEDVEVKEITKKTEKLHVKEKEEQVLEPKYIKTILKRGDKKNFPRKGDTVSVFYTGKLEDGTVFDENVTAPRRGKKPQPLRFKIGAGKVIRGWDECLKTMSSGERADVTIEPEWAYGKKGMEGKIPSNATLHFEMELVGID